jgi:hypothetical protein
LLSALGSPSTDLKSGLTMKWLSCATPTIFMASLLILVFTHIAEYCKYCTELGRPSAADYKVTRIPLSGRG